MNRGVLQSHSWWSINTTMRPPTPHHHHQDQDQTTTNNTNNTFPFMAPLPPPPPPSTLFPHFSPTPSSSWNGNQQQIHHDSWSQLLLGGLVEEEEEKCGEAATNKKIENWEEQLLNQGPTRPTFDPKQENNSASSSCYVYGGRGNAEFLAKSNNNNNNNWSQSSSSPKSCVTMLDSCNKIVMSDATRHPPPDHSSECNSTATTGGATKKPRVQPSSSTQSTFKVRKEKLGDRITALHQLVSPFGKTDTASVLLEAIGYIRFLQSQIEALSLPYLATGTQTITHQQQSSHVVQGERNSLFPEDPGQLLNDNCMKRKGISHHQDPHDESKKDLRSRGLCLVPISCTLQVGNDNGADYWAPAAFSGGAGGFR